MATFDADGLNRVSGRSTGGLVTGIVGSALGLMNSSNGIGGLFGGSTNYVSKDMADKDAEIMGLKAQIALSDSEKRASSYVDSKVLDIYNVIGAKTLELERSISALKAAQDLQNCQMSSGIAINANNISCVQNMLNGLTKTVIPNTSICPGWGTATVSVSTGTSAS